MLEKGRRAMSFQRAIGVASALVVIGSAGATAQDLVALQRGLVAVRGIGMSEVQPYPATSSYRIGVAPLPAQPSAATDSTEKVLADLERQWDDAMQKRDTQALNRLMADDFTFFSPFSGSWNATKEKWLKSFADLKARETNVTVSHELTDTTFHVIGDTAIATARATITSKTPERESKERVRFIHLWQKRAGQWRMVADHFDSEGSVPPPARLVPIDIGKFDSYTGRYDSGYLAPLTISKAVEGLVFKVEMEGGWTETFLPASSTEFFGKSDGDTRAVFVRGDAGQVFEVIVIFHGRATRSRKIASGP
jgi:uncharacterized protein (TIGR02246 family)